MRPIATEKSWLIPEVAERFPDALRFAREPGSL